jgi:hypothetical protein
VIKARVCGRGVVAALVVLFVVLGLHLVAPSQAYSDGVPDIQGKTYGEWSALWWQWAVIEPPATNPLLDTTGDFCDKNQTGQVWFLAGFFGKTSGKNKVVIRTCTIPRGQYIFFPIVNTFAGNDPGGTTPEEDWRKFVFDIMNSFGSNLTCELDGVPVVFNPNTPIVRTQSPAFTLTLTANNIFGAPAGDYPTNVSDGYWVMLQPLSPGNHVLHFRTSPPKNEGYQDITYNLTVE